VQLVGFKPTQSVRNEAGPRGTREDAGKNNGEAAALDPGSEDGKETGRCIPRQALPDGCSVS
jgi:hypothetical protein